MKVSDPSPEAFAHRDELGTVFSVSLQIALYAQEPLDALAPHAMSCFDFFANHSAHGLKWQQRAAMWRAKRLDAKTANLFPALCRKAGPHLPLYYAFAGSGPNDFTPPIFATGGYGTFSWLQVHLPVANVAQWQPLLSGLAERFRFGAVPLVSHCLGMSSLKIEAESSRSALACCSNATLVSTSARRVSCATRHCLR